MSIIDFTCTGLPYVVIDIIASYRHYEYCYKRLWMPSKETIPFNSFLSREFDIHFINGEWKVTPLDGNKDKLIINPGCGCIFNKIPENRTIKRMYYYNVAMKAIRKVLNRNGKQYPCKSPYGYGLFPSLAKRMLPIQQIKNIISTNEIITIIIINGEICDVVNALINDGDQQLIEKKQVVFYKFNIDAHAVLENNMRLEGDGILYQYTRYPHNQYLLGKWGQNLTHWKYSQNKIYAVLKEWVTFNDVDK
ncbi:MAG: hypothetical protein Edafosvirus1_138 [Edafosvirus sp.]|uniref:Uncharacterized protein n=1 Tax=Edafosvirus sp. TaxID=2487765 RepID=A0A3G4ZSD7_9VIRU|nr:MAG: hypothetical protein Edafosvirus1_138 [Edafosvirus sp.]